MTDEQTFPSTPPSVTAARRYVVQRLGDVPPHLREAIAVMVSELATNSVQHARSDFLVRVKRGDDRVRVEVSDLGSGEPALRSPQPREVAGRGLRIVGALSDDWGVTVTPPAGKLVWFTVQLPRS